MKIKKKKNIFFFLGGGGVGGVGFGGQGGCERSIEEFKLLQLIIRCIKNIVISKVFRGFPSANRICTKSNIPSLRLVLVAFQIQLLACFGGKSQEHPAIAAALKQLCRVSSSSMHIEL